MISSICCRDLSSLKTVALSADYAWPSLVYMFWQDHCPRWYGCSNAFNRALTRHSDNMKLLLVWHLHLVTYGYFQSFCSWLNWSHFLGIRKCKHTWCWRNVFGISSPIFTFEAAPNYAKHKLAPTTYLSKCSGETINKGIVFKKVFKKKSWHLIQSKSNEGFWRLYVPSFIIP